MKECRDLLILHQNISQYPRVATEDQIHSQHNNINNHIRETEDLLHLPNRHPRRSCFDLTTNRHVPQNPDHLRTWRYQTWYHSCCLRHLCRDGDLPYRRSMDQQTRVCVYRRTISAMRESCKEKREEKKRKTMQSAITVLECLNQGKYREGKIAGVWRGERGVWVSTYERSMYRMSRLMVLLRRAPLRYRCINVSNKDPDPVLFQCVKWLD